MRLEFKYNGEFRKNIKDLENEVKKDAAVRNMKEQQERKCKMRREADLIVQKAKKEQECFATDAQKLEQFTQLYEKAIRFAEYLHCDIIVESDLSKKGSIRLSFDTLIMDEFTDKIYKEIYLEMLSKADAVYCFVHRDLMQLECQYVLVNEAAER